MIKNAREYQITKAQAARFEQALHSYQNLTGGIEDLERSALQSQLADLRAQLDEYDALENGQLKVLEVQDLSELPRALIQARIAAGLSQRELAERLGVKEQQVQRYEATEYESASLSRLREVVQALKVKLRQDVVLPSADVSATTLLSHLQRFGFDRDFIRDRLLLDEEQESQAAWRTANAVGRVLRMPMSEVAQGSFPSATFAQQPMYKVPALASESKLAAYSIYARYLAERTLAAVSAAGPYMNLEHQPAEVFSALHNSYGGVTLKSALQFVWDRGLVVLPLRDSGAFHGAFWRIGGRGIIVLKQRTDSTDRWLIDLLHEYCHAVQTEGQRDVEFVEPDDSPFERRESEVERFASAWATAAALNTREQELAQECIDEAGGSIPGLKRAVPRVALRARVPTGVLANYLAYKLARFEAEDWWGTAATLQTNDDPLLVAREMLLKHLDLQRIDTLDRELLTRALIDNGDPS